MIGKITKGADFGGVFKYILDPEKGHTILSNAHNCFGTTPAELTAEFERVASKNNRVKKSVRHFSIGFAPGDGKLSPELQGEDGELSLEVQGEIAARIMSEMGYGNSQYIAVAHHRDDPGHPKAHEHSHLHIVANGVDLDRRGVSHFWDYRKLEKILRGIEQDYQLRAVECSWEKVRSTAITEDREVLPLAEKIYTAQADRPDLQTWIDRLEAEKILPRFKVTSRGKVQGVTFLDGETSTTYKGSAIGCGWKTISDRLQNGTDPPIDVVNSANQRFSIQPVILDKHRQEQFDLAVKLAISSVESKNRPRGMSITLKDETLKVYRLRPNKLVLQAKRESDRWKPISIPDLDRTDITALEKVNIGVIAPIESAIEIQTVEELPPIPQEQPSVDLPPPEIITVVSVLDTHPPETIPAVNIPEPPPATTNKPIKRSPQGR
jgi:Relaxase/Mobilisation nuclease domain